MLCNEALGTGLQVVPVGSSETRQHVIEALLIAHQQISDPIILAKLANVSPLALPGRFLPFETMCMCLLQPASLSRALLEHHYLERYWNNLGIRYSYKRLV